MKKETQSILDKLNKLDKTPPRDENRAYQTRTNFIREVKLAQTNVTNPAFSRPIGWKQIKTLMEVPAMKITSIIIVLSLLFGGTGATVAAAQASNPGDLLYPIKTLSEEIRMDLTQDESNKYELSMEFTQRRFDEIQTVLENDGIPSEEMVAQYQQQIKHNLELALEMDEPEPAIEELQVLLQNQTQTMTQSKHYEEVDPMQVQMQTMMQYHLDMIEQGLGDLQMLQNQIQNQFYMGETVESAQNQNQEQNQNQGQEQNEDGLGDQNKNNNPNETTGQNGDQGSNQSDNGGNGNNGSGGNGNSGGNGGGNGGGK